VKEKAIFDYGAEHHAMLHTLKALPFSVNFIFGGHLLIDAVLCDIDGRMETQLPFLYMRVTGLSVINISCSAGTDFLSSPIKHEGRRQFGPITAAQVSSSHALLLYFISYGHRIRIH
jgi:hypothetical protein